MTIEARLDERYGRTSGARRRAPVLAAASVGALGVIALAWLTVSGTADSVRADGTGYAVLDDTAVSISFQVSGPPDREIACVLEALDEEFGVVGWKVLVIPPTSEPTRAFTERIPTISLATTGLVNTCWVT